MFQQNFSLTLRHLRKARGYTQKQLAEFLGYSEKTVSKWECGTTLPSLDVFARLCEVLHADSKLFLNTNTDVYFLGIDGGGTKTAMVLYDKHGKMVSSLKTDASNPCDIGIEASQKVLKSGIAEVCGSIPLSSIYMYAGIAGGESGNNRQLLKSFFSDFGFAGFDCGSDNNNILRAGLGDSDGISIIMGTGFCIFKSYNGAVSRIAGWGYFFDECGSAFNLGREALSAYFSELDGTGEKTLMSPLIEKADKGERETFLTRIYDAGKTFVASFAPCVFEAAGMGDSIAKNIIDRNISGVAEKIEKSTADLLEKESKVKVVLAGGLTSQKNLPELISAKLTKPDRYDITILSAEPVIGAVNLSKKIYEENELCLKQK